MLKKIDSNTELFPSVISCKQKNSKGGWFAMITQKNHSGELEVVELTESQSVQYEEEMKRTAEVMGWFFGEGK